MENTCTPSSVTCLPGGIVFSYQYQVDEFPSLYLGCTVIDGRVVLGDNDNITNLDSLIGIKQILGDVTIEGFSGLPNFRGLNNLDYIEGFLYTNNGVLESFDGLENLDSIGSWFALQNNTFLTDINGLQSLQKIGGYIIVVGNTILKNLDGLENLEYIGEELTILGNPALEDIKGLKKLDILYDDLDIIENNSLSNLQGLDNIIEIHGKVNIRENDELTSLKGLEQLESFGVPNGTSGYIYLVDNDMLTLLCDLKGLDASKIRYLIIKENDNLSSCDVTPICDYLTNPIGVTINSNDTGCDTPVEIIANCNSPLINMWTGPSGIGWFDSVDNWNLSHFPLECENVHIPSNIIVNFGTGTTATVNSVTVEANGFLVVQLGAEVIVNEE